MPAGVVHAFEFERDTRGYVVTVADPRSTSWRAREPAFRALFEAPMPVRSRDSALEAHELEEAVVRLHREFQWSAPAHAAATEARLVTLLVGAVRAAHRADGTVAWQRGPRAALVARFRQAIETNLRSGWAVNRYAKALGVTPARLRAACLEVTGRPAHACRARPPRSSKRSATCCTRT